MSDRGSFAKQVLVAAVCTVAFTLAAHASGDRAGKVHIGNGKWVTPEEAQKSGFFEYHRRWFPSKMKKTLARWEKKDRKHAHWRKARRISTKHYRVITNVPRFIIEYEIQPFLDDLYRKYTLVFKDKFGLKSKAANKKCIHIHYGYEDYAEMNREGGQPQPRETPGFIIGGSTLVTYYDETEPEMFYGAVFHEGAHQFVQAMLPGAVFPMWIDEALATYFEGCSYSLSRRAVTVDYLPPTRLALAKHLLREKKSNGKPAWDLYAVFHSPDHEFNARHYALSWSFTYFMTHGEDGRRRKVFMKFLREMNHAGQKYTAEENFTRICKVDPHDLEAEWRAFVLGLKARRNPESPILTRIGKNRAGLDLKKGDLVLRFDFQRMTSTEEFEKLWKARPRDRAARLEVVRRTPVAGVRRYEAKRVTVVVPPEAVIELAALASLPMDPNLED